METKAPDNKPAENSTTPASSSDTIMWITYINIVLYAICYQLQRPVEPFLIQSLIEQEQKGEEDQSSSIQQTYGQLQSFFSFCQMFGSPLVGILLDRIGIRKTGCLVFVMSALSYGILAQATDLQLLFVSKIPTIFQAAFLVAQATAANASKGNASARAAALGRMTTAYTIGATIGPALGGYLARSKDFYVSARMAVYGSMLSAILSLLFLPDKEPVATKKDDDDESSNNRSLREDALRSIQIATRKSIWPLLTIKVIGGVCASMHSTTTPLVYSQILKYEPGQLGLIMSLGMFSVAIFGAIGMAPLTRKLGSMGMMNLGMLSRAILGVAMAVCVTKYTSFLANDALAMAGFSILHSLSQHVLATGLTTQTTGSVTPNEQGALLGLEHSLYSLARIGGPAIGTALFAFKGVMLLEAACGSIDVLTVLFLSFVLKRGYVLSKEKEA